MVLVLLSFVLFMPYSCAYGRSIFVAIFRAMASFSVVDDTVDEDKVGSFDCLWCGGGAAAVTIVAVSRSVSFGG